VKNVSICRKLTECRKAGNNRKMKENCILLLAGENAEGNNQSPLLVELMLFREMKFSA
jgi:hypothetical protein